MAYTNLDEVKAWLKGIDTDEVPVSSDMFDATMVNKLLDMVIGQSTIIVSQAVAVVPEDGAPPYLGGVTTLLEVPQTEVLFTFSEPADNLLLQLNFDLPGTGSPDCVTWQLIDGFDCGFTNLKATMSPNEELGVISFVFACNVITGSLTIPVSMSVPTFEGDWTLTGDFTDLADLTEKTLYAIAGNNAITSILPQQIAGLIENFSLTNFQMSFDAAAAAQTISFIRIGLKYSADWTFFGDLFTVENIEFDYELFNPLTTDGYYQASLIANMNLGDGFPFEVGGQFPNQTVFARLQPDTAIALSQIFSFLKIPLPNGFPADVGIDTLGLTFYTADNAYEFLLGISNPIPIAGNVWLDSASFDLGADYDETTGKMYGFGSFYSHFTVGTTTILLSAVYDESNGVTMTGEAYDIPIGDLIVTLLDSFQLTDYPQFISGISLDKLVVTYNTESGDFSFDCIGTIPVAANSGVAIEVKLTAICDSADNSYSSIEATGTITYTDNEGIVQIFEIDFKKEDTATSFAAAWTTSGVPIGINYIAGLTGLRDLVPPIPPDLDLDLKAASFVCENAESKTMFVLTANSVRYGLAVFAAVKDLETKQWLFYFGMNTDAVIDLSNLPIIDHIPQSDEGVLAIQAIHADVASEKIDVQTAAYINSAINEYTLDDALYPNVPAEGLNSTMVFSMQVNIGGTLYALGLDGGGDTDTALTLRAAESSSDEEDIYWFVLQQNFGPLYFEKIGLTYRDSLIYVLINCSATADGLTIGLNGFGIGLPISDFTITYTISGISVTFQNGPLVVSGELTGSFSPVNLSGALLIKNKALTISALGGYTVVDGYPSLFVYAVLDYPIGGPPYFFVNGLSAGFGFNRGLLVPDINGVATFPFVEWAMGINPPPADPNGDITGQINQVMDSLISDGVVAPTIGSNWLTMGLKFTSFEILDSFALLTTAFGTNFEMALMGLSKMVLPPGKGATIMVYAELSLIASFSSDTDLIAVAGQLTTNSYILSKSCHLTGGFAFYMWVGGEHNGDFVVTLGGYNPNYAVPGYYPQVPRLGMNWKVSSEFSIKGQEYFALTSNAVMAGGYMEATWQSGGIKAWFSVQADFMIMWKPFYYDIRASVSIGASFTIKLLFTKVKMTIHVGAKLHIWGPDFSGIAKVSIDIISFTISFGGASQQKNKTITWTDFAKDMLPQKQSAAVLTAQSQTAGEAQPNPDVCKIIITEGLILQLSDKEGALNWVVDGEKFVLTTQSTIPSKTCEVNGNFVNKTSAENTENLNQYFGIRPTGTQPEDLTSRHIVTITSLEDSSFIAEQVLGKVAKGLWQPVAFDSNGNPKMDAPLAESTLDNVLTGFVITPYVAPPDQTLPIKLVNLQYTIAPEPQYFSWSEPALPPDENFEGDTVENTIMTPPVIQNRNLLVAAINRNGLAVNENIYVEELEDQTSNYLLAEPVMCLLGEEEQL